MLEYKKHSVLPIYATAGFWVVYSLIFTIYRLSDFLICIAGSVLVYMLVSKLTTKVTVVSQTAVSTGDAEIDKRIRAAGELLAQMADASRACRNAQVQRKMLGIINIGTEILEYVTKYPAKLRTIATFLEYYLPTAVKLANDYNEWHIKGSAAPILQKLDEIMDSVAEAFAKQLENLYADKMLDITTDIAVLEKTMRMEGLK